MYNDMPSANTNDIVLTEGNLLAFSFVLVAV